MSRHRQTSEECTPGSCCCTRSSLACMLIQLCNSTKFKLLRFYFQKPPKINNLMNEQTRSCSSSCIDYVDIDLKRHGLVNLLFSRTWQQSNPFSKTRLRIPIGLKQIKTERNSLASLATHDSPGNCLMHQKLDSFCALLVHKECLVTNICSDKI